MADAVIVTLLLLINSEVMIDHVVTALLLINIILVMKKVIGEIRKGKTTVEMFCIVKSVSSDKNCRSKGQSMLVIQ